jgi:hypothetical protein
MKQQEAKAAAVGVCASFESGSVGGCVCVVVLRAAAVGVLVC